VILLLLSAFSCWLIYRERRDVGILVKERIFAFCRLQAQTESCMEGQSNIWFTIHLVGSRHIYARSI